MNLVFVWFDECRNFKNKYIQLNNDYSIISKTKYNFVIVKEEKLSLYRKKRIRDAYVLLGKNGEGKSTLLDVIGLQDYILLEQTGGKYFYVYEQNGKYFLLFSKNWDKKIDCKINEKSPIYLSDFKNENEKFDIIVTSIKNINGHIKFKLCSDLIKENHNDKFSFPSNKNMFKFINKEQNMLNIGKEKQVGLFINSFNLDCVSELFSYFSIQSKYQDFILDYNGNSNLEIIKFYMLFYLSSHFQSVIVIKEMKQQQFGNFKNFIEELCLIDKIKNLKQHLERYLESFLSFVSKIEEYQSIMDFVNGLIKFDFIKNRGATLYFTLSDVTFYDLEEFNKFLFATDIICFDKINNQYLKLNVDASSGQKLYIEVLAAVNNIIEINDEIEQDRICYLCLDELEQCMHPEWCRELFSKIHYLINKNAKFHEYYIYMSTHSPYMISDFTDDHIILLDNKTVSDNNYKVGFHTFGANIHDILKNGMFLNYCMGEYALNLIRNVHKVLIDNTQSKKNKMLKINCILSGIDAKDYSLSLKEIENKLIYFVENIGDPLIKYQLKNLLNNELYKNTFYVDDLKNMNVGELIDIIRGVCNVKD